MDRRVEVPESWDLILLAVLAAANFALVLLTFRFALTIFPNTGDEFSALFQARIFASGRLTAPAPAHAELFMSDYIASRGGRWFSIYPPAHALLLAVGVFLGDPTLAPALLSSAALVVAFFVARRAGGRGAAWLTAGLLFVSPSFRFYSASYYSHTSALLAAALCVLLALKARGEGFVSTGAAAAFAATAALGLASRPFELFWVLVPVLVWLCAAPPRIGDGDRRRLLRAGVVFLLLLAAVAAFNARQSGGVWSSVYVSTVNAGGRLNFFHNLSLSGLARLARMFVDCAKWLLGVGAYARGDLKTPSTGNLNPSWIVLASALILGAWQARGATPDARARRFLLGVAACVVAGHLFYDKEHGRFGERRFFEACFLFCFFVARLYSAAAQRLPSALRAPALTLLLLAPASLALPGTMLSIREGTEARMDPYLRAQLLGVRDALIVLREFPEFYPRFYLRNDPDLSGNVYVADGLGRETATALLPGRRRYVYFFDWSRGSFALDRDAR